MTLRSSLAKIVILIPLLSALRTPAMGSARFVISPDQVAWVMQGRGMQVSADRIRFLSIVPSSLPNAALRLVSLGAWHDGTTKAEIACADHRACLPFYVLVSDTTTVSGSAAKDRVEAQSSAASHHLIRIGDRALLVFENADSRITLHVICLENGDQGQRIRVVTTDRKRSYKAEIIERTLLRGTLFGPGEHS